MIYEPVCITFPRSCFRCGQEFRTPGQQRLCPTCRKPQTADARRARAGHALTIRERQIANFVSMGAANKAIAFQVHLTEGTVKEYLNRIFRKLDLNNRTELAVWVYQHPEGQPHA